MIVTVAPEGRSAPAAGSCESTTPVGSPGRRFDACLIATANPAARSFAFASLSVSPVTFGTTT